MTRTDRTAELSRLEEIVERRTRELETQKAELQVALDELRDTQDQLLQAQKHEAIGQLAAGIAHEINTPMQYIGDNAHFLDTAFKQLLAVIADYPPPDLDAARQRQLDMLRTRVPRALLGTCEGVDAVSKIVRAMREFSHPGSGERTAVDINHAIRSTVAVSRNEWKYASIVELDLAEALPPVHGYQNAIHQVLLNVVVNAAHAVSEIHEATRELVTGRIWISSRLDVRGVRIEVRDNGSGIAAAVLPRIFDPFFTTKPVGKGTGQGLAIARSIVVDQHGGELEVVSDDSPTSPARGTTFSIVLPTQKTSRKTQRLGVFA